MILNFSCCKGREKLFYKLLEDISAVCGVPVSNFWWHLPGSQGHAGSLSCMPPRLPVMDSPDSPLVRHLLTFLVASMATKPLWPTYVKLDKWTSLISKTLQLSGHFHSVLSKNACPRIPQFDKEPSQKEGCRKMKVSNLKIKRSWKPK